MTSHRSAGAPLGRPAGTRIVRELPLALEPVTPDPFIDDHRGGVTPKVITPQRPLVRESLLRFEEPT
jgi:hypothetical protein